VRLRKCAAALTLLAAAMVKADSEDEIARCARISSPGDRILCLEDALRRRDDPPPSTAAEAPAAAPAAEFGFDVPQKPPPSPESVRVTVVAVEKNAYGKLRYVTEDGQVWQQNDQRTPQYPYVPFAAEIRTAAAGSFLLQPLDGGIAVRVQRKQ
jgi:hypothetical protein